MKETFHEGMLGDNRDTVDAPSQDFDWRRLYERLSEDASADDQDKVLAEAVTRLLQLLVPAGQRQIRVQAAGLNLIALAWVLNPAYFAGSPSLRQLARRCGVTAATLARYTGRFSRFIRWRNRAQRHAWNWRQTERSLSGRSDESSKKQAKRQRRLSGERPAKNSSRTFPLTRKRKRARPGRERSRKAS